MVMIILGIVALLVSILVLYIITKAILVDLEPIMLSIAITILHMMPVIYIALTLIDKIW